MTSAEQTDERPIRVGVFESVAAAEKAVDALRQEGFTDEEMTVFCSTERQQEHFSELEPEAETGPAVDHAAAGSVVGGTIGGLAVVASLSTVAGIPVLVAGGMAGLMTGSVVGGLAGAMMNRGLEKESADFFDQAVSSGKILVAVQLEDGSTGRLDTAQRVLTDAGSQSISLREG